MFLNPTSKRPKVLDPLKLFVSNLPPSIHEKGLMKAFEKALGPGAVKSLKLVTNETSGECKGFGFLTVASEEISEKAQNLSLEAGGREIRIAVSTKDPDAPRQQREIRKRIVVEPHADCWFCLANPKCQKHLIVSVNPHLYLACAKGAITEGHLLILPVKHIPCSMSFFNYTDHDGISAAFESYLSGIRRMFDAQGLDVVIWERWIPFKHSHANHMQLQVLPVERDGRMKWRAMLEDYGKDFGLEFEDLGSTIFDPDLAAAKGEVKKNVDDPKHQSGLPTLIDKNASKFVTDDPEKNQGTIARMPYLYFELPGPSTAAGRRIDRLVSYGPDKFPIDFCREFVTEALGCPEKADWRECQQSLEEESEIAARLKAEVRSYIGK